MDFLAIRRIIICFSGRLISRLGDQVQAESVNAFSFTARHTDEDLGLYHAVVSFRGTLTKQVVFLLECMQSRHCGSAYVNWIQSF